MPTFARARRWSWALTVGLAVLLFASGTVVSPGTARPVGASVPGPAGALSPSPAVARSGAASNPATSLPYPNWSNLSTGPSDAGPAESGGLAYDIADGYVVWVGGAAGTPAVAQTWSYHGGAWTNRTPTLTTSPPASPSLSATYDPTIGGILAVLGAAGSAEEQTWSYAGGTWSNLTASGGAPPVRAGASLAYAPDCSCAVLFGGLAGGAWLNDTWQFSAGNWTEPPVGSGPAAREWAGLTAEPGTGGLLLVGGESGGGALSDTWTWTDGTWAELPDAGAPVGLATGPNALAPDPDGTIVAFGSVGCGGGPLGLCPTTHEFSNGTWLTIPSAAPPSARAGLELTYDAADGYVLGYGGGAPWWSSNETWDLGGPVAATLSLSPQYSQAPNTTTISTNASGGYGVYQYTYSFPGSEQGSDCPSVDRASFVCFFDLDDVGNRTVRVNVTDAVGNTTFATNILHLAAGTFTDALSFAATTLDVGEMIEVQVITPAGYPGVNFTWYGLPTDCYPATNASVSCVAPLPGFYAVSCLVADALGTRVVTSTYALRVYPDPIPISWPERTAGPAPLGVAFQSIIEAGTSPFVLAWSFGDGATSDLPNPDHTYQAPGNYTVTLAVTDATGWTVNSTEPQPIVVGDPLRVTVTGPPSVGSAPTTLALAANATGGVPPYTYNWFLPGGSTTTGPNVSVPATAPGTYSVTLTVLDASGTSVHASATYTVPAPAGAALGPFAPIGALGAILLVGAALLGVAAGWLIHRYRGTPRDRGTPNAPGRRVPVPSPTASPVR